MCNSIYTIRSKTSNKFYVGFTSLTVEERWNLHVKDAKNPKNSHLHHAIKKYGFDDFVVETIYQSLDQEHCLETMEPFFIEEFRKTYELYNIQPGGRGYKKNPTSKPVELYDSDLNLVEVLPSQSATARKLECNLATVIAACRNADVGKASRLKGFWVCFSGSKPMKKDTSYLLERNRRIRPFLGKKRPDHSKWMMENNPRKKSLSDGVTKDVDMDTSGN